MAQFLNKFIKSIKFSKQAPFSCVVLEQTEISVQQIAFLVKMAILGLFSRLFSSFHTNITILATNKCDKMYKQFTLLGFELMTFGTQVSSYNHQTRALAHQIAFQSKKPILKRFLHKFYAALIFSQSDQMLKFSINQTDSVA